MTCIAPGCRRKAHAGKPFCAPHLTAPAGQRGGWLSSLKRRQTMAPSPLGTQHPAPEVYDASNVAPKLWVGAKPPVDRSYPTVDVIVLCAAEYQPEKFPHFDGRLVRAPIPDDALSSDELRRALAGGGQVADALTGGKRVLVTCAAGINRSALVAALGLGRVTKATADELITLMRLKRHKDCLYNPHFREILRKFTVAPADRFKG